jgi:hypothetical protein
VPHRGVLSLGHGDRRWRLGIDPCGTRLRDDCVAVEEERGLSLAPHRERTVERRRQPERDLDLVRIDERGEAARGVAAVRGSQRSAEPARESHLHCRVG